MRRIDLIQALDRIEADLKSTKIVEMLLSALQNGNKDRSWLDFRNYQSFIGLTSRYGSIELEVMDRLGLSELLKPEFWQSSLEDPRASNLSLIYHNCMTAVTATSRLVRLLERNYNLEKGNPDRIGDDLSGKVILTIIVPEEQNQFSSPERIIAALASISIFYSIFAELDRLDANDLTVVGCDSGSDKSFDILGLAKLIEHVRGLITDIWDRKLLSRQTQMAANISLFAQALPVVQQIEAMGVDGTLGREQCETLKRKMLDGVTKFIDAGVITDDMVAQGANTPRLLMQPQPRLLAAPTVHEAPSSNSPPQHPAQSQNTEIIAPRPAAASGQLSDDEMRTLRNLLDRSGAAETATSLSPPKRRQRKPKPPADNGNA